MYHDPLAAWFASWWPDAAPWRPDLMVKLLAALLFGGALGLERQLSGKPAGVRTSILVCLGSAILTDLSILMALNAKGQLVFDSTRLAAQIITGIGFLGAGVIFRTGGMVLGMTTAATIWITAAVGMVIGSGRLLEAFMIALVVLATLAGIGRMENWLGWRVRDVDLALLVSPEAELRHDPPVASAPGRPGRAAGDDESGERSALQMPRLSTDTAPPLTTAYVIAEVKALGGHEAQIEEIARDANGAIWRVRARLGGRESRLLAPWLLRHPQVIQLLED